MATGTDLGQVAKYRRGEACLPAAQKYHYPPKPQADSDEEPYVYRQLELEEDAQKLRTIELDLKKGAATS